MSRTPDLSRRQFQTLMHQEGFRPDYFGCWVHRATKFSVPVLVAGPRRRDQLAFAIRERDLYLEERKK